MASAGGEAAVAETVETAETTVAAVQEQEFPAEQHAPEELSEVERVQHLAELWGVEPILARQDLATHELFDDDELRAWMETTDPPLAILTDGSIITSDPYHSAVGTARTLLSHLGVAGVMRPALTEIVRAVLRHADPALEAASTGGTDLDLVDTTTGVQLLLQSIIEAALARRTSDIHFEMRGNVTNIKFRVNGSMVLYDEITAEETTSLGNYMFNAQAKRGSLQFMTHQPLHGSMDVYTTGGIVAVRLSTAPDIRGVDIFLRLWRPESSAISLGSLGYTPLQIDMLKQGINRPYGVMVMSGPTGSGKSTSLTALLEIVDPSQKILSLEEPVERMLPNVTHVAISAYAEHGSWENLRAGLNRWDTNINMLGEIKDKDTALAIKDLATSGKMTLTTLHASNVLSIPVRMEDLGVERSMLYDPNFLVLLVNQRLVAELCEHCKLPFTEAGERIDAVDLRRHERLFKDQVDALRYRNISGCDRCHHSGIQSRVLIAEMVMMDDPSRGFVRERDQLGWRKHLLEKGWRPIADHALIHVRDGRVDPVNVENIIGRLDEQITEVFDYKDRERILAESVQ